MSESGQAESGEIDVYLRHAWTAGLAQCKLPKKISARNEVPGAV